MNWTFDEIVEQCKNAGAKRFFSDSQHGLESECLRINKEGKLSKTPHPDLFGAPLTHPYIKTDFSESQLELVTPKYGEVRRAFYFLQRLRKWVYSQLDQELLWPFSTPCQLPEDQEEIPLAQYGNSALAEKKTVYRRGLGYRYGRRMQTLSGIHYNFSFSKQFWGFIGHAFSPNASEKELRSAGYLHLARNFLRFSWLNTYLFGATPVVDRSFFEKGTVPAYLQLIGKRTLLAPKGTSLRLSEIGYYPAVQQELFISYNHFDDYIRDLGKAITTPSYHYEKIPLYREGKQCQLNASFLQMEAEFYARIRPKPDILVEGTPLEQLRKDGISYIEARIVDIDPFLPEGIDLEQLLFLHTFVLYCFLKESPPINQNELASIYHNQNQIAFFGRDENCTLQRDQSTVSFKQWAEEILSDMKVVAQLLDKKSYLESLAKQKEKVHNQEKTPSAKVARLAEQREYLDIGVELAHKYKNQSLKRPLSSKREDTLKKTAEKSKKVLEELEEKEDFSLKGYEDLELSTQAVIREALKRRIQVEVLDRKQAFIRLTKGEHWEYVQQATKTSKDSFISYHIMENKNLTNHLLREQGITVPKGCLFHSLKEAEEGYSKFSIQRIVIKPNFSNYGLGIAFVEPNKKEHFLQAVRHAFRYSSQVLVESFVSGEEYRFLVIDQKVIAVSHRVPPHVVGDGHHTVSQLVRKRNHQLRYRKTVSQRIRFGKVEKKVLADEGIAKETILAPGQICYLRKNSNVSTGGEAHDVTGKPDRGYSEIALKAAHSVGAFFCGVDMLIQDLTQPPNENNYALLELNYNPALYLHRYPAEGKKRYVEKAVLDALGF